MSTVIVGKVFRDHHMVVIVSCKWYAIPQIAICQGLMQLSIKHIR